MRVMKRVMRALLKNYPEPLSPREIAEIENLNYNSVITALRKLCERNVLERISRGKYIIRDLRSAFYILMFPWSLYFDIQRILMYLDSLRKTREYIV